MINGTKILLSGHQSFLRDSPRRSLSSALFQDTRQATRCGGLGHIPILRGNWSSLGTRSILVNRGRAFDRGGYVGVLKVDGRDIAGAGKVYQGTLTSEIDRRADPPHHFP